MKNLFVVGLWCVLLVIPGLCQGAEFEANDAAEIQAAFDVAASNGEDDSVRIAAGVHAVSSTLSFISKEQHSLRIEGQGRGVTVLDGGGRVRVMAVDTTQTASDHWTTITVTGVSFSNGYTADGGGGLSVIVDLADIMVEKSGFTGNVAEPSDGSFIDDWRGLGGGGLFIATGSLRRSSGSEVTILQSNFTGNSSYNGGGAYILASSLMLHDTHIEANIFDDNSASMNGGGLWVEADQLYFNNNTVVNNNADSEGGGVNYFSIWRADVFNNIFWWNTSRCDGGDFYFDERPAGPDYIKIFNNTYQDRAFLIGDSISEGSNSTEDPALSQNNSLLIDSPCIDSGNNEAPNLKCGDYNGYERIHGGVVDRGAVEFDSINIADANCNNPGPTDPPITPSSSGGGSGGGCFIGTAVGIDPESEAYKAAKRMADRHNSPDVEGAIKDAKKRLRPKVEAQCRQLNQDAARSAVTPGRPELLVFISSSMPPDSTIDLARDAHRIRGKSDVRFVLRGFPEGGLADYLQAIQASRFDLDLTVDPFLYNTFEIEQVPAVVVNRNIKVDHPRNLKSALTKTQAASDQQLIALIRDLNW